MIGLNNFWGLAKVLNFALAQPKTPGAEPLNQRKDVRHKQKGKPSVAEMPNSIQGFLLEIGVPYRQSLVNNQDVRVYTACHRETEAYLHT